MKACIRIIFWPSPPLGLPCDEECQLPMPMPLKDTGSSDWPPPHMQEATRMTPQAKPMAMVSR